MYFPQSNTLPPSDMIVELPNEESEAGENNDQQTSASKVPTMLKVTVGGEEITPDDVETDVSGEANETDDF